MVERSVCLLIHAELGRCDCFYLMASSSLWLQDPEGFVVAPPGPPQCSGPQVSVGRFPLQQDSAQVPRCGCKQHRELSNKKLFLFFFVSELSPLCTPPPSTPPPWAAHDWAAPDSFQTRAEFLKQALGDSRPVWWVQPKTSSLLLLLFSLTRLFSAHQRLLETTKDSASAACPPRRSTGAAPAPPIQVVYLLY